MNRDRDNAISDEELAAAALTLATLEDGAALPAHLRERVEASGRKVLGERAKDHAQRRADKQHQTSTTSAGTQVIVNVDERPPSGRYRRISYAWGVPALALAAALVLVVRSRAPAPALAPVHDIESIPVGDSTGARGELRYDRSDGTGVLTLGRRPAANEDESLELWITFEGDAAPRPVALLGATSSEVSFGAGTPFCRPGPGPSCAPVKEVFLTRESRQGTFTFVGERTVLRGRPPQR